MHVYREPPQTPAIQLNEKIVSSLAFLNLNEVTTGNMSSCYYLRMYTQYYAIADIN